MGKRRRRKRHRSWHNTNQGGAPHSDNRERPARKHEDPDESRRRLRRCTEHFDERVWDIGEGMSLVMHNSTSMGNPGGERQDCPTLAIRLRANQPALTVED